MGPERHTGGPSGTSAHVDADLVAKIFGTAFRKADCRITSRQEDNMMGVCVNRNKDVKQAKSVRT